MWYTFSIDPSFVANYTKLKRGHVNFMVIWHGMTQKGCAHLQCEVW